MEHGPGNKGVQGKAELKPVDETDKIIVRYPVLGALGLCRGFPRYVTLVV